MQNFVEKFISGERGIRNGARIIAVVWSLIWIVFGFLSGVGENLSTGTIIFHSFIPGLIFLATTLVACWQEGFGGLLFLIEGLAIAIYFLTRLGNISAVGAYFALFYGTLPALVLSALFIYSWKVSRNGQNSLAEVEGQLRDSA